MKWESGGQQSRFSSLAVRLSCFKGKYCEYLNHYLTHLFIIIFPFQNIQKCCVDAQDSSSRHVYLGAVFFVLVAEATQRFPQNPNTVDAQCYVLNGYMNECSQTERLGKD